MGWFRKQKVKDFVSPSQEQREALGEGREDENITVMKVMAPGI